MGMPMRQAVPHVAATADIFDFYAGLAGRLYDESFTLPNGSMTLQGTQKRVDGAGSGAHRVTIALCEAAAGIVLPPAM